MSVMAMRFNPVLTLETVTRASAITAPVGSVMVPKAVASWVCASAEAEHRMKENAKSARSLRESCLGKHSSLSSINRYYHPVRIARKDSKSRPKNDPRHLLRFGHVASNLARSRLASILIKPGSH